PVPFVERPAGGVLQDCPKSQDAFALLLRRHGPLVLSVCRRVLGREEDAVDAFQATWLVLIKKAASLKHRDRLGKWLFGVAYRTAPGAKRATARRRAREA